MSLSKRGDYVVRSALCLARAYAGGEHRKIREVVAEMDIPPTFASQILADLVRAGLATSRAGKAGGYRLVRSPAEVSVLEIIEAGEGSLRSERCALGAGPCRWERVCPLHDTWVSATAALRSALGTTSLADLVERDEAVEGSHCPAPADSHRHGRPAVAIEDWVQIELPVGAVRPKLLHADSWLASCVESGYRAADELRCGVDPVGMAWSLSVIPAATLVVGDTDDAAAAHSLTWEAGGSSTPWSRFDGTLAVRRIDRERTELRVQGTFHPPAAPNAVDPAVAERLGRAAVRTTLRQLAKVLEQLPVVRGRAKPLVVDR